MNIFLSNIPCEQCRNLYDNALPMTSECYKSFAIYCEENHPDTVCQSCYGSPGPPNPQECSLAMSNTYQAACGIWFEKHSETMEVKLPDGDLSFLAIVASLVVFTMCICCCLYYYWNQEQRNRGADDFINHHHDILLDDQHSTWQHESITPGLDFGNQKEGNATSFRKYKTHRKHIQTGYIGEGRSQNVLTVAGKLYGSGVGKCKTESPRVREILQRHRKKQAKFKRNREHTFLREDDADTSFARQTSAISDSTIAFLEEDTPRAVNQNGYNMSSIFDQDFPNLPLENSQPISDSTVDFLLEGSSPIIQKKKQPLAQVAEKGISSNTIAFLTSDLSTLKSTSKAVPSFGRVDYATPRETYTFGANPRASPLEHTGENQPKNVTFVDGDTTPEILQDDEDAEENAVQSEGGRNHSTPGEIRSNLEVEDQLEKSISPTSNSRINSRINLMFDDRESEEETHLVTYVTPRGRHHEVNYYAPHRSADTEETLIVSISRNSVRTKPPETVAKDVVYSPINFAKKEKALRSASRTSKKRSRSPSDFESNVSNSTESIRKKRRSDSYAMKRDASLGGGMLSDARSVALSSGGSTLSLPISIGGSIVPPTFVSKRTTPKERESKQKNKSYEIPLPGHGKHISSSYSTPDPGIRKRSISKVKPPSVTFASSNPTEISKSSITDHTSQLSMPKSGVSSSSAYNKEKKNEDENEPRHVLYDSNISDKQNDKDSNGGAGGGFQSCGNLSERAMDMIGRDDYFPDIPNDFIIGDKKLRKPFSASGASTDVSHDGGSAVTAGTGMSYAHLLDHFSKDKPLEQLEAEADTEESHSRNIPNTQPNWSKGTSYSNLVKRFFSNHDDAAPGRLQTYADGRESSHSDPATDSVMEKELSNPSSDVWAVKSPPPFNPADFQHFQDGSSDVFVPSERAVPATRNIYQMFLPVDEPPGPHGTKFPSLLGSLESNMDDSEGISFQLDNHIDSDDKHRDENGNTVGAGDISSLFGTGRMNDLSASNSRDDDAGDDSAHSLPTSLRSSRVGRTLNEGENHSFGFDNDDTDNAHE